MSLTKEMFDLAKRSSYPEEEKFIRQALSFIRSKAEKSETTCNFRCPREFTVYVRDRLRGEGFTVDIPESEEAVFQPEEAELKMSIINGKLVTEVVGKDATVFEESQEQKQLPDTDKMFVNWEVDSDYNPF